jgi:hypothetical protein
VCGAVILQLHAQVLDRCCETGDKQEACGHIYKESEPREHGEWFASLLVRVVAVLLGGEVEVNEKSTLRSFYSLWY